MIFLNNVNKIIIDSGWHVQEVHLNPHKILTQSLLDSLFMKNVFTGMWRRFRFICIVIPGEVKPRGVNKWCNYKSWHPPDRISGSQINSRMIKKTFHQPLAYLMGV